MKLMVTGHRDEKLVAYDLQWIQSEIDDHVGNFAYNRGLALAYSGMASGIDLMFCESCKNHGVPYIACIPFEGQELTMTVEARLKRENLLASSVDIMQVRNNWMVEHSDRALVIWDGGKGGTHNVVQQLVEARKGFYWVNPVSQVVWPCLVKKRLTFL